jgi:hypothetical protein
MPEIGVRTTQAERNEPLGGSLYEYVWWTDLLTADAKRKRIDKGFLSLILLDLPALLSARPIP